MVGGVIVSIQTATQMGLDTQFSEFVRRQQRPAAVDNAWDWGKEKDDWLAALDGLYKNIGEFLQAYIDAGEIKLRESPIELNEENIGVYPAKRLAIYIGAQEITLTPIGTLLIGSKGRVDVEGSAGSSRLVLIDRDVHDVHGMFKGEVRIIKPSDLPASPPLEARPPKSKKLEPVWRIVSRPPAMQFIDLNKDSFFDMLMEVSNG